MPANATLFEDVLMPLRERFPEAKIKHIVSNGQVFITLPLRDGCEFEAGLTWLQAKYLAHSQISGDELKDGNLPPDWPPS